MPELEWRHDRRRIQLPLSVLKPFPPSALTSVDATALLDTGATISGVSRWIMKSLNLPTIGKRPISTANGLLQTDHVAFRIGIRDDREALPFVFDDVMGFTFADTQSFDVVLGMDILNGCDLRILRDGTCRLAFG